MMPVHVQRVLVYGSETWALNLRGLNRLGRAEKNDGTKDVWSVFKG